MSAIYWTEGTFKLNGEIALVKAENYAQACLFLGVLPEHIHKCSTPGLTAQMVPMPTGKVVMCKVAHRPSAYDRFARPDGKGWDYEAMADAGYDVS